MSTRRSYGQISDLINLDTEWGVSVQEAKAQPSFWTRVLKVSAYSIYVLASFVAIPLLIGFLLMPESEGMAWNALLVLGCIGLAVFFQAQAKKGPRNAIQIDHAASEVRLGSQMPDGTFVRHRICTFRQIKKVSVDNTKPDFPTLCLHLAGEKVQVSFKGADPRSLEMVAVKISAACESAKKAPIRSRVQSVLHGIDATYREVGQRVKSRVVSRAV